MLKLIPKYQRGNVVPVTTLKKRKVGNQKKITRIG